MLLWVLVLALRHYTSLVLTLHQRYHVGTRLVWLPEVCPSSCRVVWVSEIIIYLGNLTGIIVTIFS